MKTAIRMQRTFVRKANEEVKLIIYFFLSNEVTFLW